MFDWGISNKIFNIGDRDKETLCSKQSTKSFQWQVVLQQLGILLIMDMVIQVITSGFYSISISIAFHFVLIL